MEEHESYKRVVRILHDLENQYIAISDNKLPEKQAKLRNDINAHFDKIMAAINLRKVEILTDIDAEFGEQASKEENQRNLLQTSVEGCKKLLEAGTTLYSLMPQIAIETWNSARSLEQKHLSKQNIAIQYDSATSRSIATYGKVIITKSAIVSDFRAGTITTLAGSTQGFMDGLSGNARLSSPHDICYCSKDNCCYIADFGNNAIRRITSQGVVSTFFEDVAFRNPTGIIYYQMENCFIVTTKHNTIFRIYSNGTYDILAGSMQQGDKDGKREASFNFPIGITIDDESGDVFVADYQNHSIRKITQEGEVSTIAGSVQGNVDGVGSSALFNGPWGIHFNKERNSLFVGDYANNQIREISLVDGTVTTICNISCPVRIISLPDNSLLALSHNQNQIISLTQKGGKWTTSCFAGSGKLGKIDGNAIECQFYHPLGITFDPKSHACVAVELSSLVRKVWCF